MAFIEKTGRVVKVENDEYSFEALVSFQTENYVGEWNGTDNEFAIFHKKYSKYMSDIVDTIYADSLEDLMNEVKNNLGEEIIEVYNRNIIKIRLDLQM